MDPYLFDTSPTASEQIEKTKTDVDIALMSFDMSAEYIKEFYRLLWIGSSFSGYPFTKDKTNPITFSFKERKNDNAWIKLTDNNWVDYIFFPQSLKPDGQINMINTLSKNVETFIYTLGKQ